MVISRSHSNQDNGTIRFGVLLVLPMLGFVLCSSTIDSETSNADHSKGSVIMNGMHPYTNRLIDETSPYLLQHAHNPVDWYPWGDEAIARAKREDRPIFLSIGYSACHWCHVMERESFENEEIAALLNKHFVSIKVDREERPDLDEVYMTAVQMLTGGGGWPMSVFLTPDLKPFYGGTYFPPEDRFGKIGFTSLVIALADTWDKDRQKITSSSAQITEAIRRYSKVEAPDSSRITTSLLDNAVHGLSSTFDRTNGGFGDAPKFPQSMAVALLLRQYVRTRDESVLEMATTTLDRMAHGGMYDQLGGGFHRYSTDREWLVPHFEKMLYDNALLSDVYLEAYQLTAKPLYAGIARQVLDYVLVEMTDEAGGFHSTQDADSERKEGEYYLWTHQEIIDVLGSEEGQLLSAYYSVAKDGNFSSHEEYHQGQNVLHVDPESEKIARENGMTLRELETRIDSLRSTLLQARGRRIRPGKDDKIITAWNGLMISSLAHASRVLGDRRYLDCGVRAAEFIIAKIYRGGKLHRTYRTGRTKQPGYLDDYAYLTSAFIDLYEAGFDPAWLLRAEEIAGRMVDDFLDTIDGGFHYTAEYHQTPVARTKSFHDGAIPSGNAVAALALLRLSRLLGKDSPRLIAENVLLVSRESLEGSPRGHMGMLRTLDFYLDTPKEIALVGNTGKSDTKYLLGVLRETYLPNKVVAFLDPADPEKIEIESNVPLLKGKTMMSGVATAYVCADFVCKLPVNEPEAFREMLEHGNERSKK